MAVKVVMVKAAHLPDRAVMVVSKEVTEVVAASLHTPSKVGTIRILISRSGFLSDVRTGYPQGGYPAQGGYQQGYPQGGFAPQGGYQQGGGY